MAKDLHFLDAHTTSSWVQLFVRDLKRLLLADGDRGDAGANADASSARRGSMPRSVSGQAATLPRRVEVESLVRAYREAKRRVFFFGLDGTLIPQVSRRALPSGRLAAGCAADSSTPARTHAFAHARSRVLACVLA
jgi:hypothetical protein